MVSTRALIFILIFVCSDALRLILGRLGFIAGASVWSFILQVGLSSLFVMIIFLLPFKYKEFANLFKHNKKLLLAILALCIWHYGIGTSLSIAALNYTIAPNVAFLMQLTLFFIALWEVLFLKQRFSKKFFLALPFSVVGLYLLSTSGKGFSLQTGDILIIASTFIWSVGEVLSREMLLKTAAIPEVFAFIRPFGFLVIAPIIFLVDYYAFNGSVGVDFTQCLDLKVLPYAFFSGFFLSIAWICSNYSYSLARVSSISLLTNLRPVIVTIISVLFLYESLEPLQIFGAGLILFASCLFLLWKSA